MRIVVLVALLAFASMEVFSQQQSAAAPAVGSPSFDGTWNVVLSCPDFRQGTRLTKGYSYQFLAQVAGGILHGQHGTEGAPSWLRLDGTILPDGTANLTAHGLTGEPEYTVGRVMKSTPYSYHVTARFEASRGSGQRVELRPCEFGFVKQ